MIADPTPVEYAVMLALIIVVTLAAIQLIGKNACGSFKTAGGGVSATGGTISGTNSGGTGTECSIDANGNCVCTPL